MNFIKRLLSSNSVDAILADFHSVTARLRDAIGFHTFEVELHDAAIQEAEALKADALAEVTRAKTVVANIEKMLGMDTASAV